MTDLAGLEPLKCTGIKLPRSQRYEMSKLPLDRPRDSGTLNELATQAEGWVAQLVEQGTENPCVRGSTPFPATRTFRALRNGALFSSRGTLAQTKTHPSCSDGCALWNCVRFSEPYDRTSADLTKSGVCAPFYARTLQKRRLRPSAIRTEPAAKKDSDRLRMLSVSPVTGSGCVGALLART